MKCILLLVSRVLYLCHFSCCSFFCASVFAAVMGHAPFYGLHTDDRPLGSPRPKPGGFRGGRRRQDKAEDLGAGGAQTGTSEGITEHR